MPGRWSTGSRRGRTCSRCASIRRRSAPRCCTKATIDVGMIPSIEYLPRAATYRIVPGHGDHLATGRSRRWRCSRRCRSSEIRTIAADTSSRTSNALLRILCAERFGIAAGVPADGAGSRGDARGVRRRADHRRPGAVPRSGGSGVEKIDLGEQWTAMTGLPFVWAFWAGRPGVLSAGRRRRRSSEARDARRGRVGRDRGRLLRAGARRAAARRYLRDNIQYALGEREMAGLRRYLRARGDATGLIDGAARRRCSIRWH